MKFLRDEKGQGLSEYALIIALVAVVAIAGLILLGPIILDKFNEISCGMQGEGWGSQANDGKAVTGEGWWYFKSAPTANIFTADDKNSYQIGRTFDKAGCYKVTKAVTTTPEVQPESFAAII